MSYKGYSNFSQYLNDKVEPVTTLGIDVIGFVGRHPIVTAILLFIIFFIYKIFGEPFIKAQSSLYEESEYGDQIIDNKT